jgi:Protein of unknown function (DUF4236)
MPLRYFRRIRIMPGVRVNLSKSGASVSVGRRGFWYTVGPRGRRVSVGLPGTGLYWVEQSAPPRVGRFAWLTISLFIICGIAIVLWAAN